MLRTAGSWLLRRGVPGTIARRLASARGRSLVLVYHRVGGERGPLELAPRVPADLLRRHIAALGEAGRLVALEDLRVPDHDGPPRFALTFDDDYASHHTEVLPILRALGVPATFFLCGRRLHGLGAYWWEVLEERAARGLRAEDPATVERDPRRQQQLESESAQVEHLDAHALGELAGHAGIGFHTLRHPLMPPLGDEELGAALREGRAELAAATGRPLRLFAYPHGKADARCAAAVRSAGYAAAFTGRDVAVRPGDDPHRLGRWEAGAVDVDTLLLRATARLWR